ncbi:MAG: RNA polymerase factor sigma-32 [Deltaproteobacteria bacterium]|nr:RNA polymerase factor sigma-32 [Deltaproteobacteria bacterium]
MKKIRKPRTSKSKSTKAANKDLDVEILPAEEQEEVGVELEDIELESDDSDKPPTKASKRKSAEKPGGVVPYDPLRAYLSEIRQHPRLSKEEEKALAIKYIKTGDLDAAYKLIVSNLYIVVAIARKYQKAARSVLDLIQEGNIGLMDAVKNFDPYREVRFPSYASWWVKAYIIRYIIANWRLVKIGTTQAQRKLFFNLEKEKERLEKEGFVPTTKLLASNLNVKEKDVIEMQQRLSAPDMSVDAPVSEDSTATMHSLLPDRAPNAEQLVAQQQINEKIQEALDSFKAVLDEKEVVVFEQRMLAENKATLQDLADQFSLSKERVRQIENKIKEKLKDYMRETLGDEFLDIEMEAI